MDTVIIDAMQGTASAGAWIFAVTVLAALVILRFRTAHEA